MASWFLARLTAGQGTQRNKTMMDLNQGQTVHRQEYLPNRPALAPQSPTVGPAESVLRSKHKPSRAKSTPKRPTEKVVSKETGKGHAKVGLGENETAIQRRGTCMTSNDEQQKKCFQNQHMANNSVDLKELVHCLGICHVRDLASMVHDEPLTEAQIGAFRNVFEHFAKNSNGSIDADALSSTLESVGIATTLEEVLTALESADYDGDGTVGFHDFLSMMTDFQRFTKCVKSESSVPVNVSEKVFYRTLTKLLSTGALPSSVKEEIIQYYHKKTLHLIRQAVHVDENGGHVLTYYSKGAHLLGLSCKQLTKYLTSLVEKHQKESPYLKRPCLNAEHSHTCGALKHHLLSHTGRMKSAKTWRTVEIEDRVRELSIKHPGMETKEMITPVKIKVDFTMKERERLTFDQIEQIVFKSQAGLKRYLRTLAQYKRAGLLELLGLRAELLPPASLVPLPTDLQYILVVMERLPEHDTYCRAVAGHRVSHLGFAGAGPAPASAPCQGSAA